MFYGLSRYLKKILPKQLFYRSLIIVAAPIIIMQITISIVFFDSLWIKTNKGMTRALVNEISTFVEAYNNENFDKDEITNLFSLYQDLNKHLIFKNDKEFKINNTEKTILEEMVNSPGKTFSREEIGRIINLDKERSIDVIITRLRKKIEIDPKNPKYLQTIRGEGYVLWIE